MLLRFEIAIVFGFKDLLLFISIVCFIVGNGLSKTFIVWGTKKSATDVNPMTQICSINQYGKSLNIRTGNLFVANNFLYIEKSILSEIEVQSRYLNVLYCEQI